MRLEANLQRHGSYPVYAFGYDWRQSCAFNGALLVQQINSILQAEQAKTVLLLTHSMGGLVTRAALQQGGTGLASQIEGVIHAMIPAEGAVVAYRRFHTGATLALDGPPEGGFAASNAFLNQILGVTPVEYAITQAGLPGPMELLPTNGFPTPFLTAVPPIVGPTDMFNVYKQNQPPGIVPNTNDADLLGPIGVLTPFKIIVDILQGTLPTNPSEILVTRVTQSDVTGITNNITGAQAFHQSIQGVFHPKTALLFGDNVNTDVQFIWTQPPTPPVNVGAEGAPGVLPPVPAQVGVGIKSARGDGTVPQVSARFDGVGPVDAVGARVFRRSFPVLHAECFKNTDFQDATEAQILRLTGASGSPLKVKQP